MRIVDLRPRHTGRIRQAALLLYRGFQEHWPNAWPSTAAALDEVHSLFDDDRISLVAVDSGNQVLGWIGGIQQYDGHAWELHPLVVHGNTRRQGIGRALVTALEERVRQRGGITLYLGTDDEDFMTSIAGVDLYPDVLGKLAGIRNLKDHPYGFYQRLGFSVVGVIPDANGPGKPDIFMAKRIAQGNLPVTPSSQRMHL